MKIGILGAGNIVPDFLKASSIIEEIHIVGICASHKSKDKMEKFQKEYNIDFIYYDFESMIKNSEIDVVYIAVPNNLHHEFAKKSLLNNKHIIVEKPFASNYKEAKEVIKLAKEKELYVFEAITNQYFPNYFKINELTKSIGDIKIIELNFSQYSSRYDLFKKGEILPVFDYKKSGGALMDLNVYNIYFVLGIFGKPATVDYYANVKDNIDTSGVLILSYDNFKCVCIASKDSNGLNGIRIQGENGNIYSDKPANSLEDFIYINGDGDKVYFNLNENKERLYYELKEFCNVLKNNDKSKNNKMMNLTLEVMKILDSARVKVL